MSSTFSTPASRPLPMFPRLEPVYAILSPLAEPLLRAVTGLLLLPHGAQKAFGWFGGYGLDATGAFFAAKLGLPAGLATLAAVIELGAGLALALGLFTRPAAALVAGLMAVAVFHVHLGKGFFWTQGGYEYPLLWGILALFFVIRGGGAYSVDARIGREI